MSMLRKLPTEIHRQILELLPRKTVYQCMLVCKHWSLFAIPIYYTTLSLSGEHINFLNSKLLLYEQDQQFAHGKFVKALISPEFSSVYDTQYKYYNGPYLLDPSLIRDHEADEEDEEDEEVEEVEEEEEDDEDEDTFGSIPKFSSAAFLKLLSYLPNLKKIDLYSNAYYEFYMTILANYGRNNLRKIQEIRNHFPYAQIHLSTCYEYRQTITRLEVFYDSYCINNVMIEPTQFLSHFTRLTCLKILNFEVGKDLTMFDILNICPHLVSFEFESGFSVSSEQADESYKRMIDTNFPPLKVLVIVIPKMLTTYMHYIIYNTFNLKSLTVSLFQSDFVAWIKECNIKTLAAFINRLGNIDHLNFDICITTSDDLDEFINIAFTEFGDLLAFIKGHYPECYNMLNVKI